MIIDYIFYRTFVAYEKKQQPGLFSATAYCAVFCLFLFLPILGLVGNFFEDQKSTRKVIFILYVIIVITSIFFRYYRENKLKQIIEKYKTSKYNEKISTWLFFIILPVCMIVGIWALSIVD